MEELDFFAVEIAEETRDEEVMEDTELSFRDSTEFFFTAETDFDLDVLLIELRDSEVISTVDSAETIVSWKRYYSSKLWREITERRRS